MDQVAYERTKRDFVAACKTAMPKLLTFISVSSIERDFDELCADERLRYVGVKSNSVHLVTFPMIIRMLDNKPFGPAAYIVQMNPISRSIICENVDGVQCDIQGSLRGHHPHVNSSGVPCLGSNLEQIQKWFADGRLGKIGIRMLDFLEIARGDNHYVSPYAWNRMNEEEVRQCLKLRQAGTK